MPWAERGHVPNGRRILGDGVLMYASDYPHSEWQFPNSIDDVLAWTRLDRNTQEKQFWGNAARRFRQS